MVVLISVYSLILCQQTSASGELPQGESPFVKLLGSHHFSRFQNVIALEGRKMKIKTIFISISKWKQPVLLSTLIRSKHQQ